MTKFFPPNFYSPHPQSLLFSVNIPKPSYCPHHRLCFIQSKAGDLKPRSNKAERSLLVVLDILDFPCRPSHFAAVRGSTGTHGRGFPGMCWDSASCLASIFSERYFENTSPPQLWLKTKVDQTKRASGPENSGFFSPCRLDSNRKMTKCRGHG